MPYEPLAPPSPYVPPDPTYLGDGVYASFDGYQIWLTVDRHDSAPLVALEAPVVLALMRYAKVCWSPIANDEAVVSKPGVDL